MITVRQSSDNGRHMFGPVVNVNNQLEHHMPHDKDPFIELAELIMVQSTGRFQNEYQSQVERLSTLFLDFGKKVPEWIRNQNIQAITYSTGNIKIFLTQMYSEIQKFTFKEDVSFYLQRIFNWINYLLNQYDLNYVNIHYNDLFSNLSIEWEIRLFKIREMYEDIKTAQDLKLISDNMSQNLRLESAKTNKSTSNNLLTLPQNGHGQVSVDRQQVVSTKNKPKLIENLLNKISY